MSSQKFPLDDPFANTAFASQPTHVQEYVGCEPVDAGWLPGLMHDGYVAAPLGLSWAAVTGSDGGSTPATNPRGFIWRRQVGLASKTQAILQLAQFAGVHPGGPLTGATSYLALLRFSAFTRMQAGTLTDAGLTVVRYVDCTGYELAVTVSGTSLLVSLWRYKAGSAAVEIVRKTYTGMAPQFNFLLPFGISLEIANVGGNPTMIAALGPFTLNGTTFPTYNPFANDGLPLVTSSGVTVTAGIVTDAHADKVATPGHSGFACGRDRTLSGTGLVDLCSTFRVYESGVLTMEDRFERAFQIDKASTTDSFSIPGRSLQAAYAHDGFADGTSYVRDLDRDGTNQRAAYAPAVSPVTQDRYFLSQRLADSPYNQHRRVAVVFDTTGSAPDSQRAGVVLRATQQATAGTIQGYVAYAQIVHSGTVKTVRIARTYGAGETVLAEVAGTFPLNSSFTIALDCYLHPSSPTLDGPAVLKVYIDGVQAVLVSTGQSGVSVDLSGTVTDTSSARITSGAAEGIYARWSSTLGNIRTTYLDTWTQLTLQDLPATQDAQESIVIDGEGTADGSLNDVMRQDFEVTKTIDDPVLRDPFDSGHTRHASATTAARRRWSFNKESATEDEVADLADFWDDHNGHEVAFNYTPPGDTTAVKCAIDRDTLSVRKVTRSAWALSFDVVELLT